MASDDIPIVQRTYDLYRTVYEVANTVPKLARYTLYQTILERIVKVLDGLMVTSYLPPQGRLAHLIKLSGNVDTLKLMIRLAMESRAIDKKKYVLFQTNINEIGKMLGGWIKSIK